MAPTPEGEFMVDVRGAPVRGRYLRDVPAEEAPGHAEGWTHYLERLRLAAANLVRTRA